MSSIIYQPGSGRAGDRVVRPYIMPSLESHKAILFFADDEDEKNMYIFTTNGVTAHQQLADFMRKKYDTHEEHLTHDESFLTILSNDGPFFHMKHETYDYRAFDLVENRGNYSFVYSVIGDRQPDKVYSYLTYDEAYMSFLYSGNFVSDLGLEKSRVEVDGTRVFTGTRTVKRVRNVTYELYNLH